tara:strand:+ start:2651 stop:3208 length:558 start_codon:yes stop_codon:yes gene_type:complete
MWAKLNADGSAIEEIIVNKKSIVVDGVTHPKDLFNIWSDEERLEIDVVPVTTSGTHLNTAFYVEADASFAIASNKKSVVRTIGVKASDKSLSDLKTAAKEKAGRDAHDLLKGFDWLIARKVTANTTIPLDVVTYMAAIRTDHKTITDAVDGAGDMAAFVTLHDNGTVTKWTSDSNVAQHRRNSIA